MHGQLWTRFACVLLTVGVLAVVGMPCQAVIVVFPDANLEARVRTTLSIPFPTPVTDADMTIMASFDASRNNVANIQGLEYATNLTRLALASNTISDISPVSGLRDLTYLSVRGNQISNISAVTGLADLTYLDAGLKQVSDISAICGLTSLTYLDVVLNQISDISAV